MTNKLVIISFFLFFLLLSATGDVDFQSKRKQESSACKVTTSDVLGPYYRPDAPVRNNIRRVVDVNHLIEISGTVKLNDCRTPLKNIYIEFWHANSNGHYDNDSKEFYYRAKVKTDNNGNYSLKTILPGRYMTDGKFLPAHINFRIKTDLTKELVSQIYFEGDPYLNPQTVFDQKMSDRIVSLKNSKQDIKKGLFDIVLEKRTKLDGKN